MVETVNPCKLFISIGDDSIYVNTFQRVTCYVAVYIISKCYIFWHYDKCLFRHSDRQAPFNLTICTCGCPLVGKVMIVLSTCYYNNRHLRGWQLPELREDELGASIKYKYQLIIRAYNSPNGSCLSLY